MIQGDKISIFEYVRNMPRGQLKCTVKQCTLYLTSYSRSRTTTTEYNTSPSCEVVKYFTVGSFTLGQYSGIVNILLLAIVSFLSGAGVLYHYYYMCLLCYLPKEMGRCLLCNDVMVQTTHLSPVIIRNINFNFCIEAQKEIAAL